MTDEELLKKFLDENGTPEICKYCFYENECKHGADPMSCRCSECSDETLLDEMLDSEAILADIKANA